jgi:hypothetical protein
MTAQTSQQSVVAPRTPRACVGRANQINGLSKLS